MDFIKASPDVADLASASSCGMRSEHFWFVAVMSVVILSWAFLKYQRRPLRRSIRSPQSGPQKSAATWLEAG